jgi:hypothetical protein
MTAKTWMLLAMLTSVPALAGCVPVAVGAGGAIAADRAVEEEGGNLF